MRGSTLRWYKPRGSAWGNLKEQPITKQQRGKDYITRRRSERELWGKKKANIPRNISLRACHQNYEKESEPHHGPYQTTEQAGPAARRLRPSEGPRGTLLPPGSPSMPRCRRKRGNRGTTGKHLRSESGATILQPEAQEHAKGSNLGERSALGEKITQPSPSLRTRMVLRGMDCNNRRRQEPLHGGKSRGAQWKNQRRWRGGKIGASGGAQCKEERTGKQRASGGGEGARGKLREKPLQRSYRCGRIRVEALEANSKGPTRVPTIPRGQ